MKKEIKASSIVSATLLSIEEYKEFKKLISPVEGTWWLRSPGIDAMTAACVFGESGDVYDYGAVYYKLAVRPALQISNPESLKPGDKFNFGENSFTYLGEGLALCDNIVGNCAFREDWEASDTNDYEASDVKKYVDDWLGKELQRNGKELQRNYLEQQPQNFPDTFSEEGRNTYFDIYAEELGYAEEDEPDR